MLSCWSTVCDDGATIKQHKLKVWCLLGNCERHIAVILNQNLMQYFHKLHLCTKFKTQMVQQMIDEEKYPHACTYNISVNVQLVKLFLKSGEGEGKGSHWEKLTLSDHRIIIITSKNNLKTAEHFLTLDALHAHKKQVGENYSCLLNLRSNICKSGKFKHIFHSQW